jgi:hypothetical protein
MERLTETPQQTVAQVNARLADFLDGARRTLRGEAVFRVQDVRRLRDFLSQSDSIAARFSELRRQEPELVPDLDLYKSQLLDLSITLRRIHLMLLAQRTQMESDRARLDAVGQWAATLRQTCDPAAH